MKGQRGSALNFKGPSASYLATCDRQLLDGNSELWHNRRTDALCKLDALIGGNAFMAWIDALPAKYDSLTTASYKDWAEAAEAKIKEVENASAASQ